MYSVKANKVANMINIKITQINKFAQRRPNVFDVGPTLYKCVYWQQTLVKPAQLVLTQQVIFTIGFTTNPSPFQFTSNNYYGHLKRREQK